MKRTLIAEGDGQAIHRRATHHTATAEIFAPPGNPAQSVRNGAGVRLSVQPDGTWQVTAIDAYAHIDPNRTREFDVVHGDLRQSNINPATIAAIPLPDNLTAADAFSTICALTDQFGWCHVLYDRDDVGNGDTLTDEQWQRITATPAWRDLNERIRTLVHRTDLLDEVIVQARIRCTDCYALLDPPPADTEPARCTTGCNNGPDTDPHHNEGTRSAQPDL